MGDPDDLTAQHNAAMLPLLRIITRAAATEAGRWVILESLCLGIGKLNNRTPRQIGEFLDTMATRIAAGERE